MGSLAPHRDPIQNGPKISRSRGWGGLVNIDHKIPLKELQQLATQFGIGILSLSGYKRTNHPSYHISDLLVKSSISRADT